MSEKNYKYILLAAAIFITDRLTKLAALAWCTQPYIMNEYLSFEVMFNRGVSWGMFHSAGDIIYFIVSSIIVLITAILCWHAYQVYKTGGRIIGHICIIAGSCANLIDRALYGGVIDFIIISYKNYSWPVFNIADAAIVCGVALLIFFDEKT